jgi:16S rRNA (guanine527-N7)-methyltransferase
VEHDVPDGPPAGGPSSFPAVLDALAEARELGFLGPGPIEPQVRHALGFAEAVGEAPSALLDLGSGGGLPGLVLLAKWPSTEGVLLDSNERRTDFLGRVVTDLGWGGRVRVVRARAEDAGRDRTLRGQLPLIVSRGFGPPPVVAECAAPLLVVGGRLAVSEPPEDAARWPAEPLARLGLVFEATVTAEHGRFTVLRQASACPEAYPRRIGIPGKRPLW